CACKILAGDTRYKPVFCSVSAFCSFPQALFGCIEQWTVQARSPMTVSSSSSSYLFTIDQFAAWDPCGKGYVMAGPIAAQCPECDVKLKIKNPAAIGKKIACPKCGEMV